MIPVSDSAFINYEDEVEALLFQGLSHIYGISEKPLLFQVFYLRCFVENGLTSPSFHQLLQGLITELNLPVFEEDGKHGFRYRNVFITLSSAYQNSCVNIMESWFFRFLGHSLYGEDVAKLNVYPEEQKKLKRGIRQQTKNLKSVPIDLKKAIGLEYMKTQFNLDIQIPFVFPQLYYGENYNPFNRSLDEKYNYCLKLLLDKNITEKNLEDYLIYHLDLIEEGLTFISRQFAVTGGFLDILTRDSTGNYVIIELKIVDDDARVLVQAQHYPEEIKHRFHQKQVRFITVAPGYTPELTQLLHQAGAELFTYHALVKKGMIHRLQITRLDKEIL